MKRILVFLFMLLMILLAFCATAMCSVDSHVDGEGVVMSTGPPLLGVFQTCDAHSSVEPLTSMNSIDVAGRNSPNLYDEITPDRKTGRSWVDLPHRSVLH